MGRPAPPVATCRHHLLPLLVLLLPLLSPSHARPKEDDLGQSIDLYDFDDGDDHDLLQQEEQQYDERYVGLCKTFTVRMWPGNSRRFWSYGYVYLKQPYLANCTLRYIYKTRIHTSDPLKKFGFRVTGSFDGVNDGATSCSDTDYVYLDDTAGVNATYCGAHSNISFVTSSDYFEFNFVTKENSPRAKGFFVVIESFLLCGGTYTHQSHGPTGVITSPLHPENYPADLTCSWWFTAMDEATIRLMCSAFLLEDQQTIAPGNTTCLDYLSFTSEVGSSPQTTTYCSTELAVLHRAVYSSGSSLLLGFRSDSVNQYSGFNCTYEFIKYSE
ncbi:cubilin-like [Panulirus ornatus]|uniref:cubilin-like n=1 Tax=Panulirus ornatus TaxID=150431 RepID=UPI003A847D4B